MRRAAVVLRKRRGRAGFGRKAQADARVLDAAEVALVLGGVAAQRVGSRVRRGATRLVSERAAVTVFEQEGVAVVA